MNKPIFFLLILVSLIKVSSGQSLFTPGKRLEITLSAGHAQYKEQLFNGLRNDGVDLSLGLNYGIQKNAMHHEFGWNIDAAGLWNRYGWSSMYLQISNLHYRLLADVGKGLQLGGNVGYSSSFYRNENFDSQHNYWITTLNLGLSTCYSLPINSKWTMMIPVNIPLVGFLSRPAENRNLILNEPDLKIGDILKRINSNFKFVTIGSNYFDIETGLFFRTQLRNEKQVTFGYRVRYEQTATSLKTQLFTNQLCIQYPLSKHQK
ncbi:MAG TPA: hypothetical protein PKJ43_04240 [Prolixibacteraceae bacterium]|nr:hypothetical protein [Prolixibacteraceae bacterium]